MRHVAMKAQEDGQTRQKADEERWIAKGGRAKVAREGVLKVEDAVKQALQGKPVEGNNEQEEEDDDEEDDDYRGSASETESGEDKENLPAAGSARRPHEPVSDFDGSGGDEEADADKENSLELAGMGPRSPAPLGAQSPAPLNGQSPARTPRRSEQGLSPALSPSHLRPHSRVSSTGSRLPLSQLGDEETSGGNENAAVTRAPLGELDVELDAMEEDDEAELPRRPKKRAKSGPLSGLSDDEEGAGKSPSARLMSPLHRRLASPSQRLGSPTPRTQPRTARFLSPPSRLRSPLPTSGTQSFSQVETQAMLGGLGDVFGFESQAPAPGGAKDAETQEGGGGLTQLFANAEVTTSSAFAALRSDANNVELTQDERSKLLYRPVIKDDELRRDQELFEREDEIMARPFSPTQREKETQEWLNERGLWTQTRPPQTQLDSFGSTSLHRTQRDTPSPLASPTGSDTGRRRIVRRGAAEAENAPVAKLPSVLDRLMSEARLASVKEKKKKKKTEKSEFIEGEAAESDDEYGDFGPRARDEDEGDGEEGEEQHVEGLVDDAAMDEHTENAADVQAKYLPKPNPDGGFLCSEQNAEDDARNEKVAREVVAGKYRNRRRGRGDNMDLDDDESDDDGYTGPKKLLKKRKIENDGLDGLEKHESTRPFVEMYNKGIKSADDDDFSHLNQKYTPSSVGAEAAFGLLNDDSDEEPTWNLPDAAPRTLGSTVRKNTSSTTRLTTWASHEGSNPRVSLRGGQGASVTGHSKHKAMKGKAGSFARPAAPTTSSSSSNKLSRLGSKANGFV
ncbi:hypothetical protein FRC07_011483 [Ceratobasidium sp. 392]|nr:hypothetical protein FRC07_011483 [Ceratobasidium sp. 392]